MHFEEQGWGNGVSTGLPTMWSGSNPSIDAICGLRLLLGFSIAPSGVSPGTPVFPSPQKTNIFKSQLNEEWQTDNRYVDVQPLNHYLFYLFLIYKGIGYWSNLCDFISVDNDTTLFGTSRKDEHADIIVAFIVAFYLLVANILLLNLLIAIFKWAK